MQHLLPSASLLLLTLAGPALSLQDADARDVPVPEAEVPAPAAELAAYAPLIGTWEGSGTVKIDPNSEPMPWTATGSNTWVVGGHGMLESMRVEVTGQDMPPFVWSTLHAYDTTRKSLVSAGAGSQKGFHSSDAVFSAGSGTIVSTSTGIDQGQSMTERSIWSARGDAMTITIYRAIGAGAPFVYVTGSFKRTGADAATVAAAAARGGTLVPELEPLAPMIGRWALEGTWRPTPDAPAMEIQGQDTFGPIAGGAAILGETKGGEKGGPNFYEAIAIMGWDAERGVLCTFSVDNMGSSGQVDQYVLEGRSVASSFAGAENGVPFADSSETRFVDGKLSTVSAKRMVGGESFQAFSGTYTPMK